MPDRAEVIHQALVAEGFARRRDASKRLLFEGSFDVRGRKVAVEVAFQDDTLTRLPILRLIDRGDLPGVIGHIDGDDAVCFARNEELQLDPLTPGPTVALCLHKMREGLGRIASTNLTADIEAEFPQHWLGRTILFDLGDLARGTPKIYSMTRAGGADLLLADDAKALNRFSLSAAEKRQTLQSGREVALVRTAKTLSFANGQAQPATMRAIVDWANGLESDLGQRIVTGLAELPASHLFFFVRAPNGCVGARITLPPMIAGAIQRKSFLAQRLGNAPPATIITRYAGTDVSAGFMFRRNLMEQPNLAGISIALVGAGTIGGLLSKFLTQSGAGTDGGRLTIFDPQQFTAGNVGRHFLGVPSIGKNKAEACRDDLAVLYPDNSTVAVTRDFLQKARDFSSYELIIDATGEQSVSDVINQRAQQDRDAGKKVPPIIFGWLEGNGVAARALVVDGPPHACFRCLRLADGVTPRFKIIQDDHPARLTPANCGEGAYFAYGVGAPAIAAGLMMQLALDLLAKRPEPRLRNVRIVHDATMQVKDQNPVPLSKCPVCGGE